MEKNLSITTSSNETIMKGYSGFQYKNTERFKDLDENMAFALERIMDRIHFCLKQDKLSINKIQTIEVGEGNGSFFNILLKDCKSIPMSIFEEMELENRVTTLPQTGKRVALIDDITFGVKGHYPNEEGSRTMLKNTIMIKVSKMPKDDNKKTLFEFVQKQQGKYTRVFLDNTTPVDSCTTCFKNAQEIMKQTMEKTVKGRKINDGAFKALRMALTGYCQLYNDAKLKLVVNSEEKVSIECHSDMLTFINYAMVRKFVRARSDAKSNNCDLEIRLELVENDEKANLSRWVMTMVLKPLPEYLDNSKKRASTLLVLGKEYGDLAGSKRKKFGE